MIDFHNDAIFPKVVIGGVERWASEVNSAGGPGFQTSVVRTNAGRVYTSSRRQQAAWKFTVQLSRKKRAYNKTVENFVLNRHGSAIGFLFEYALDHNTSPLGFYHGGLSSPAEKGAEPTFLDQYLGVGDGTTTRFPLVKRYIDEAGHAYEKRIWKPKPGTILVGNNGTQVGSGSFTVDYDDGDVDFGTAPADGAALTWGGSHYFPVTFDVDIDEQLSMIATAKGREALSTVTMVELLHPSSLGESFSPGGSITQSVASTLVLNRSARTWVLTPVVDAVPVRLPDPNLYVLALGGPHLTVFNASVSNTFDLQTASGVSVRTINPGESVRCYVAKGISFPEEWFVVV